MTSVLPSCPLPLLRRIGPIFVGTALAFTTLSAASFALAGKPRVAETKKKKAGAKDANKAKSKASKAPHQAVRAPAPKASEPLPEVKPVDLHLQITRFSLDNGLRVVLHEDHSAPVAAIALVYNVGSRDEEKGQSGFAQLFGSLMFQGSEHVKKGEHKELVTDRKGSSSSSIGTDFSGYFDVLPPNELALGLWLEADRLASLRIAEDTLETGRDSLRQMTLFHAWSAPREKGSLRLEELVFQGFWPYEHAATSAREGVDAATVLAVKQFWSAHYGPNNAVLSISGDIKAAEATELIHKYFDKIPKISATSFTSPELAPQTTQRTAVIKDAAWSAPAILYGWRAPETKDAQAKALDLAAIVLGGGETSRLPQLLVSERALAESVAVRSHSRRGPGLFEIDAKLWAGAKVADADNLIDRAVADLAAKGPTAEELARAQQRAITRFVLGFQTSTDRARALAEHELLFGDATGLAAETARFAAVTADDIRRAVAEHLSAAKRTVVEMYPVEPPSEAPKPKSAAVASIPVAPHASAPAAPHAGGNTAQGAAVRKNAGGPHKHGEATKRPGSDKKKALDTKNRKKKGSP